MSWAYPTCKLLHLKSVSRRLLRSRAVVDPAKSIITCLSHTPGHAHPENAVLTLLQLQMNHRAALPWSLGSGGRLHSAVPHWLQHLAWISTQAKWASAHGLFGETHPPPAQALLTGKPHRGESMAASRQCW